MGYQETLKCKGALDPGGHLSTLMSQVVYHVPDSLLSNTQAEGSVASLTLAFSAPLPAWLLLSAACVLLSRWVVEGSDAVHPYSETPRNVGRLPHAFLAWRLQLSALLSFSRLVLSTLE